MTSRSRREGNISVTTAAGWDGLAVAYLIAAGDEEIAGKRDIPHRYGGARIVVKTNERVCWTCRAHGLVVIGQDVVGRAETGCGGDARAVQRYGLGSSRSVISKRQGGRLSAG